MQTIGKNLVISGSSITTDHAWPTWATWVTRLYQLNQIVNVSARGMGNELILLKAIEAASNCQSPTILVQLTSTDKWDWYVQDLDLVKQINKEKHPIIPFNQSDKYGFWSTGSHFPVWKEYFFQNYFSQDYFTLKTLVMIQWFQLMCQQQNWPYLIIFDSPVLSVTESQLLTGQLEQHKCYATTLVENELCRNLANLLDLSNIYLPGLIGFACLNKLPWYHARFNAHPGSLVHLNFVEQVLVPKLDTLLTQINSIETIELEANRFQSLMDDV
jgi:hypothetical protein